MLVGLEEIKLRVERPVRNLSQEFWVKDKGMMLTDLWIVGMEEDGMAGESAEGQLAVPPHLSPSLLPLLKETWFYLDADSSFRHYPKRGPSSDQRVT